MIQVSFTDRGTGKGDLRPCEVIHSLLPINQYMVVLKTCKWRQTVRLVKTRRLICSMTIIPAPYWVMTWGQVKIDLENSSCTSFESSWRDKHNGANPMSVSFLVRKLYRLQFPRHFIFNYLWWPKYWPDPKMFYVKVIDLWHTYPTQFAVCRYDVWFSRSDGGGGGEKAPPPQNRTFQGPPGIGLMGGSVFPLKPGLYDM